MQGKTRAPICRAAANLGVRARDGRPAKTRRGSRAGVAGGGGWIWQVGQGSQRNGVGRAGRAVCGRGAPTSGAQLAGAGRWLGCWATRDGCCERADDARVGPRERVGLLCARRAGAECGAGLRRWAGADWAARVGWAGLEALREWAGAEKGLGPCGRRMGWAVGVLGPGLVSLLGLDSFSNFFSYF